MMTPSSSDITSKHSLLMMGLISSALTILTASGLFIWVQLLPNRKVTVTELILIDLSILTFNGLVIYLFARNSEHQLAANIVEKNR